MIALVDCNNFFASCERLFRPELVNKPVAVLSSNDGCIVARSNEVKALGVKMGAPHFMVKDILEKNNVEIFSSNFALYSNISQRIVAELSKFSPKLEVYSIDEAFLDLTELNIKDYTKWASDIKTLIQKNIGMPVSVGVAPTKTLAKLASEYAKSTNGSCWIDPFNEKNSYYRILESVEVGDVWGVGRKLSARFRNVGIRNAWQLSQTSSKWLSSQAGVNGLRLHSELSGIAVHQLEDHKKPQKNLMASRSFGSTVQDLYELEIAVATFASQAANRLRRFNQTTGLFGIFLKYKDGDQVKYQSASAKLMRQSNDTSELTAIAIGLLKKLYNSDFGYKKAGVFAYDLASADIEQQVLFDNKDRTRQKSYMNAIDEINRRYGPSSIKIATVNSVKSSWRVKSEKLSPAYTTSWKDLPKVYAR